MRNETHIIKAESQVSDSSFLLCPQQRVTLPTAIAQMPLKQSACVVNNGKNQVSSGHWLLRETGEESVFHEGLRLKNIFLT